MIYHDDYYEFNGFLYQFQGALNYYAPCPYSDGYLLFNTDIDRNGKISIYEAFSYANYYKQKWLSEYPQLDDNGDGISQEGHAYYGTDYDDGAYSKTVYLGGV